MHLSRLVLAASLTALSLTGQTTTAGTTVNIGGLGCQGGGGVLTNGVVIGSFASYSYDAGTGVLSLTVQNTTPVVPGESNATIAEIWLNVPPGAVTGAVLNNQVGNGGAAPAFTLAFDDDTSNATNSLAAGCFGNFNLRLTAPAGSGIANPAAPSVATPNPVLGPVTFTIQLSGPGTAFVDAEAFLAASSQGGPEHTNLALRYEDGGANSQDSGIVGSCDLCRTSVYLNGAPAIGQTFDICVTGGYGCHACVWVSETPGPTVVNGITIPVGLPVIAAWDLGNFGLNGFGNVGCLTINVPNNPQLQGFQFYLTNVTYNALNLQDYSFSLPRTVTVQ